MDKDKELYIKDIAEAYRKDKIISCGVQTEVANGNYGETLTYTIVVENKQNPKLALLERKVSEAIKSFVYEAEGPTSLTTNFDYSKGEFVITLDIEE